MNDNGMFHYTQCGLDNVWLVDGWHEEQSSYGSAFAIDRAEELHKAIAKATVQRPDRLRGQEARFLRTMLSLSQEQFGKLLGVDRATVIRWEKARTTPLSRMNDIAVRTSYAAHTDGDSFVLRVIKEMQANDELAHAAAHQRIFETREADWRERREAA